MFRRSLVSLALLGTLLVSLGALADDAKPAADKTKEALIKGMQSESALTVDFAKSLGLSFESLTSLGVRIEEARKVGDPVALANSAQYLAAAEAAAGKKATLTAEMLMKEATEMAKERNYSSELKAVGMLFKGSDIVKEFPTLAVAAEKREAAEIAKFKSGDRSRGIIGYVTAVNNTANRIFVSEDSVQLGWVEPYCTYTFNKRINHGTGHNSVLRGRSPNGVTWGPVIVDYNANNFTLTLD